MKKYSNKRRSTFTLLTLGCSKNVVDSENLISILESKGLIWTKNIYTSDYIIINTCGFINPAKKESIELILEISQIKKEKNNVKIIVMGCLSQRYMEPLKEQLKDVDFFFGVDSAFEIAKIIAPYSSYFSHNTKHLLTPEHYTYIKISEGCNHKCSFCAIPMIRGNHISRPIEEIIKEVETLYDKGVKEFNIIGQDSTYYGYDLYKKRKLTELIYNISEIVKDGWIRLLYTYPTNFPEDVLDLIAEKNNICNYIDLPLQHISNKLLKSMKRGITSDKIKNLLSTIRKKIPDIAIRSTFIVGYPEESDKDFEELLDFISEQKLERVGAFIYSHEDNTSAYKLGDTISEETKNFRLENLLLIQKKISLENNMKKISTIMKILIDEKRDNMLIGRTQYDAPDIDNSVIIPYTKQLKIGNFANVIIKDATEFDLIGKMI